MILLKRLIKGEARFVIVFGSVKEVNGRRSPTCFQTKQSRLCEKLWLPINDRRKGGAAKRSSLHTFYEISNKIKGGNRKRQRVRRLCGSKFRKLGFRLKFEVCKRTLLMLNNPMAKRYLKCLGNDELLESRNRDD